MATKKSASPGVRTARKKTSPASGPAPAAKKPRTKKEEEPAATAKPATAKSGGSSSPRKTAASARTAAGAASVKGAKGAKAAKKTETAAAGKPAATTTAKTKAARKSVKASRPAAARSLPDLSLTALVPPNGDPIGDTTDGEGRYSTHEGEHRAEPQARAELVAYRAETADDALEGTLEPAAASRSVLKAARAGAADEKARPAREAPSAGSSAEEPSAHLDRLQKILSQAGIASRRHAEEMILAGRVMVNGQVITQLGAKADPAHDHIKVDGKHIPAAERHRYFMLNKPRGYVTTVNDPEGRPTVMEFFSKMRERLYPVGRLDYESEGLLLVTNDGELANQLTRAASGVEKTYLVKIAGRPSAEELEQLRSGVFIERGAPGSDQTQTAPARIRELRSGGKSGPSHQGADNPWYEVVLIEGRNRELRKMFQSVGHFVEKIRRVGYGPLVLDLAPGQMRELTPEELTQLRRAAEGKLRPAAKPERFDSSRKDKPSRSFEPRPERGPAREFPPRREPKFPPRGDQKFGKRAPGGPDRFPARREDRGYADRRPAARGREDRSFGARPAPSRSFSSGDRPFRKFDSGRPPGPGSRGPRFDSSREGDRAPSHRSQDSRPDRRPNPNFDRSQNRDFDRGFDRGPKRSFGGPRKDFARPRAQGEGERPGPGPKRFEPGRTGEQNRFGSQRGGFNRPRPDRPDQDRSGPRRADSDGGKGRPFSPRAGRGSGPRPSGSNFGRGGSSFRPQARRGDFRANPRSADRSGPRSAESGFGASRDSASRRPPFDPSRKKFPPRPQGEDDRPRGGKPKRFPPRPGGRKRV